MTDSLKYARDMLEAGGYSCVLVRDGQSFTATARGVAPLLAFLDCKIPFDGYSAADKVVGAGAAYLYVLLGVRELYAAVISERAREVAERHGITLYYDVITENIRNRAGDGICPIEQAVADASDPEDALIRIRSRLKQLSEAK